jgi:hypothetical protein
MLKQSLKECFMEHVSHHNVRPVFIVHENIIESKKELVKSIESYVSQLLATENTEIIATYKGLEKPVVHLEFYFDLDSNKIQRTIELKLHQSFSSILYTRDVNNDKGHMVIPKDYKINRKDHYKAFNKNKDFSVDELLDFDAIYDEEVYDLDYDEEINIIDKRYENEENNIFEEKKAEGYYSFAYEIFKDNLEIRNNILSCMSSKLKHPERTNFIIDISSLPDESKKKYQITFVVGLLVLILTVAMKILNYTQKN